MFALFFPHRSNSNFVPGVEVGIVSMSRHKEREDPYNYKSVSSSEEDHDEEVCHACQQPIEDEHYITVDNDKCFHEKCLKCRKCGIQLENEMVPVNDRFCCPKCVAKEKKEMDEEIDNLNMLFNNKEAEIDLFDDIHCFEACKLLGKTLKNNEWIHSITLVALQNWG